MSLRPSNRTEVRKKSYKSGVEVDEARRRRTASSRRGGRPSSRPDSIPPSPPHLTVLLCRLRQEGLTKQEDKVEEEMQEKIAVVGEPTLSGATQTDDATEVSQVASEGSGGVGKVSEKMDETPGPVVETSGSLDAATDVPRVEGERASGGIEVAEGKNDSVEVDSTTLVQTSRDLDVEEGKDKATTIDLEDSEGMKELAENTVESAKDGGDNTKEATAKTPQRQSNSIFFEGEAVDC